MMMWQLCPPPLSITILSQGFFGLVFSFFFQLLQILCLLFYCEDYNYAATAPTIHLLPLPSLEPQNNAHEAQSTALRPLVDIYTRLMSEFTQARVYPKAG